MPRHEISIDEIPIAEIPIDEIPIDEIPASWELFGNSPQGSGKSDTKKRRGEKANPCQQNSPSRKGHGTSMNIAYQGIFLKEGLKQLGHNLIEVAFSAQTPLMETLGSIPAPIDMVILELFGTSFPIPPALADCPYPMVAYAVDAPLNIFWLSELCRLFDHVFVDQVSSVHKFKQHGIRAQWLPLCAQDADFKNPGQEKIHDIVFVGRESPYRLKRHNLLNTLRQHFSIHTAQGISHDAMMALFAQSKIVLNENLFNGLTLRTFQGLASGSVLLTEAPSLGLEEFFTHGKHLVTYTPDTIIQTVSTILKDYETYRAIGEQGQALCQKHHTSLARARSLFAGIEEKTALNTRRDDAFRHFSEAKGRYYHTQRFGGELKTLWDAFKAMATSDHPMAAQAAVQLGDMAARRNAVQEAETAYTTSIALRPGLEALLRLAFLYTRTGNYAKAKHTLAKALRHVSPSYLSQNDFILRLLEKDTQCAELYFIMAHLYFAMGKICHLGFQKSWPDNTPDTAIAVGELVWHKAPSPAVMDFILTCAREEGAEGEILPMLTQAIREGLLSDPQILYTAELAHQYYDKELASRIASSFKQTLLR